MTRFLIEWTVNNHGAGKHQWDVTITDISEFNHVSVRTSVPVFSVNQTCDVRSITTYRFYTVLLYLPRNCLSSYFFHASLGHTQH